MDIRGSLIIPFGKLGIGTTNPQNSNLYVSGNTLLSNLVIPTSLLYQGIELITTINNSNSITSNSLLQLIN